MTFNIFINYFLPRERGFGYKKHDWPWETETFRAAPFVTVMGDEVVKSPKKHSLVVTS